MSYIGKPGRHLPPKTQIVGNEPRNPQSPGQVHLTHTIKILGQTPRDVFGSRRSGLFKSHLTITKEEAPTAGALTAGEEEDDQVPAAISREGALRDRLLKSSSHREFQ